MQFEWDTQKATANIREHKVTFEEATTVFYDPLSATLLMPIIRSANNDLL